MLSHSLHNALVELREAISCHTDLWRAVLGSGTELRSNVKLLRRERLPTFRCAEDELE